MKPAFTLIEILTATMIMGIVMVVSIKSIHYMNHIHQQNEIRYLALNRLDSEMSRLVMAYDANYTGVGATSYNHGNTDTGIRNDDYGLRITIEERNFVQLKNIGSDTPFNKVEDGDFVAILNFIKSGNDINLTLIYPYIYHTDTNFPLLWNYPETLNLKTSIRIP